MPPPRLPRHLRPCHHPGAAVQFRCAHEKARAKFPTNGDDTPQSSTPDASPKEKKSWWSAILTTFGAKTQPTESSPPPPPSPAPPSSAPTEDDKELRKEKAHEPNHPQVRRVIAYSDEGKSGSGVSDSTHTRNGESDHPTARRVVSHTSEETPGSGVDNSIHTGDSKTVPRKDDETLPQTDDKTSIQSQLQELYAQVRALQDALKAQSATRKPSSASTMSQGAPTGVSDGPPDSKQPSNLGPRAQGRKKRPSASVEDLYKSACVTYRRSVAYYGQIATVLVSEDMPSRAIAPMAVSLIQRLAAIEHGIPSGDEFEIRKAMRASKDVVRSLATRLDVKAPAYTLFKSRKGNEHSVPNTNMIAKHIHALANQRYLNSIKVLVEATKTVEDLRSPTAAPMAVRLRGQLSSIISGVVRTREQQSLWPILSKYENWKSVYAEARYSSSMVKPSNLMFNLLLAESQRTMERTAAVVESLQVDISQRRMYAQSEQSRLQRTRFKKSRAASSATELQAKTPEAPTKTSEPAAFEGGPVAETVHDGQRLTRQIQTRSRSMMSSNHLDTDTQDTQKFKSGTPKAGRNPETDHGVPSKPEKDRKIQTTAAANRVAKPTPGKGELSEQSLLDELFPEANTNPQPRPPEKRDQYPKIDLPDSTTPIVRRELVDKPPTLKEQVVNSFQKRGEQTAVLQLSHCSTELTEADFRRLIPKGKHIEAWQRGGDFYKIIPGRDPLSLERMPFYYLLFKDSESALTYQKNASRLHKLSALHQPANILSAIPAPKGFLEDGENINAAVSSYNLLPIHHAMSLNVLMQPYNPALRALIERGGYQPIAPSVDENGERIWKVLMHIEGYEPSPSDLFKIFSRDAYVHGMSVPLRNESHSSIHRLRDIINLKTKTKPISSVRPRAYGAFNPEPTSVMYEDPAIQSMLAGADEDTGAKEINQWVMNRVYNRWVFDFEDEDSARRFAVGWHRKVLPELSAGKGAWKDGEEMRICNTEVLW